MQGTPNSVLLAAPSNSSGVSNAKAIGLFSKITARRLSGGAPSTMARPHGAPSVVSRLNDKVALAETHFPDFFENVKHASSSKRNHGGVMRGAMAANSHLGAVPKWSTNNGHDQQPTSARIQPSAVRRLPTDKTRSWREPKAVTEPLPLKPVAAGLPERPSTAGQLNSNNRETDPSLSSLKGYVRTAQDKMSAATMVASSPRRPIDRLTQVPNKAVTTTGIDNGRPPTKPLRPTAFEATRSPFKQDTRPATSHGHASSPLFAASDKADSDAEICFGETPDIPGVPVVYRSQKARLSDPERLNLDRRSLKVIPLLEGEHMLRLLNLQNNLISSIDNLHGLPSLIFLDLYNNQIESIDHLHVVPNLRVLMLGKNKLKRIERLDCLAKLDVLDLHSNEIEAIDALDRLVELRVLNLAGNRIRVLENIANLSLLTELNLRRNAISSISAQLGKLPALQRLFLSNNRLETKESILPLFQLTALTELRLDGNLFNHGESTEYRPLMIQNFVSLRNLDLKVVTDDERRDAYSMTQRANEKRREQQREENQEAQRIRAITAVRKKWEERFDTQETLLDPWQRPAAAKPAPASIQIGFSEVEVSEDARTLYVYGDALEALESAKVHNIVTTLVFKYVPVTAIAAAVAHGGFLRQFVALRRVELACNHITTLDQLGWIAQLGARADELAVTNNPVATMKLLRPYVAHTLRNVSTFNDVKITPDEVRAGAGFFDEKRMPKQPPAPDRSASVVLQACLRGISKQEKQLKTLNKEWSRIVQAIIKDTLEEIQDMDTYMAKCLDRMQ
ncbi:Outer Dynein Arm Light Chain 1 [Achlya hypogyna]|uniref:Outer Dynein Arm Light Chain 1 n=1 Tax=Achlya hypogyna TaxID=1202772 RepID=A0A1V9YCU6_ACHHY|nr:Outer Dynein Arm Light Chain 1 [Achlya hypogyna]